MQELVTFLQHHMTLVFPLALTLASLMVVEFIRLKISAKQISPQQLTQAINRDTAAVIDLRSQALFTEGHIIGAQSIPFAELTKNLNKLNKYKQKTLIVTCALGNEANRAAIILKKHGFDTQVLRGGMRTWRDENLPVVKG